MLFFILAVDSQNKRWMHLKARNTGKVFFERTFCIRLSAGTSPKTCRREGAATGGTAETGRGGSAEGGGTAERGERGERATRTAETWSWGRSGGAFAQAGGGGGGAAETRGRRGRGTVAARGARRGGKVTPRGRRRGKAKKRSRRVAASQERSGGAFGFGCAIFVLHMIKRRRAARDANPKPVKPAHKAATAQRLKDNLFM